ncbi:DUF547 domain-containing protein [Vibrio sp. SM6]|uniref:DUF547 domain-containing protein n=1 Tax=Vibrio agarilyticus TaxID=2726741 RepID=A0A7X8TPL0_9VIBR|nr:DUF547 domain-containing protein [Vibrio agarilyticus]NLS12374.1 DUF547 domain-containing protein [Vibrio agarilyticus]
MTGRHDFWHAFLSLGLILASFQLYAAPKAELWPFWQASNESNHATIDHQPWQTILDRYLLVQGQHHLFDYQNVSASDKHALKQYIRALASLDPRDYRQAEQYAYWVNLYNALTVDEILDHYPIRSITKLGGIFTFGPWDEDQVIVAGKTLTLNDIEHRILRPIWQDPRTHYAVNCASLGCPNLQLNAFTSANQEQLLDQAAKAFIRSPKGVLIQGNRAQLSTIYQWFSDDFGGEKALFEHISQYAPEYRGFTGKIRYDYDWSLNQP